jgi:hypothetical protein
VQIDTWAYINPGAGIADRFIQCLGCIVWIRRIDDCFVLIVARKHAEKVGAALVNRPAYAPIQIVRIEASPLQVSGSHSESDLVS